jgi:hypothetical protein
MKTGTEVLMENELVIMQALSLLLLAAKSNEVNTMRALSERSDETKAWLQNYEQRNR